MIGSPKWVWRSYQLLLLVSFTFYFVDFLTLGGLKRIKNRVFSRLYLSIYRCVSIISLAFLYRPVLYNMLDNRLGKRAALLAIPYLATLLMLGGTYLESHPLLPSPTLYQEYEGNLIPNLYYDDLNDSKVIKTFSIPSRIIENNYLELFLVYEADDNRHLKSLCPDFYGSSSSSLRNEFIDGLREGLDEPKSEKLDLKQRVDCIEQLYRIQINDSLQQALNAKAYIHPNKNERGILCMLDIQSLDRGYHTLTVEKNLYFSASDSLSTFSCTIPFWKE